MHEKAAQKPTGSTCPATKQHLTAVKGVLLMLVERVDDLEKDNYRFLCTRISYTTLLCHFQPEQTLSLK